MRKTKEAKAASRDRIVAAATRLFRERGIEAVSVADVMAAAGMTHGGFYAHFHSKEALAAAATQAGFEDKLALLEGEDPHALLAYINGYLSEGHVRDVQAGCPIVGFGPDAIRLGGAVRDAVAAGAERTLAAIAQRLAERSNPTSEAIAMLSTMIGALLLARSISNEGLRTQILTSAQDAVDRLSQEQ